MNQPVYGKLHQFTDMGGQMSMPVHQYLLDTTPSVMFATGSHSQAEWILPQVKSILGTRSLDYLFVSHMEADECGGISLFLKKYPHVKVICSSFTASEIRGYGYNADMTVVDEGRSIRMGDLDLMFFRYPSEVHLHDGLLVYENNSGIFYSSDLMFHHILKGEKIIRSDWAEEVESIDSSNIADETRRERLKKDLHSINPKFIAAGHGSCLLV